MKTKYYSFIFFIFLFSVAFAQPSGTTNSGSMDVGGVTRTYTYYVPLLYNSASAVPLVINMHGAGNTSASQETTEDFRMIADTANFIVVHPQGLTGAIGTGWNVLSTLESWESDKVFIINLLEKMASDYNIDRSRVYVTGYSEGGFMSYDFACFVTGRFAAIASVCGSLIASHYSACTATGHNYAIPVMEIHGTADPLIGYAGGGITNCTNVDTMINYWVNYNQCNSSPTTTQKLPDIADSITVDNSTVMHYVYTGGTNGATVELYKVLNGGHTVPAEVPASGTPNQDFTASKEAWRFFRQYNLNSLGVPIVTGTLSATPITGVVDSELKNTDITVSPNPSDGLFTLTGTSIKNTTLKICNIMGEVVFEQTISKESINLDLVNVSKGVYFYVLNNSSGAFSKGKLIINND